MMKLVLRYIFIQFNPWEIICLRLYLFDIKTSIVLSKDFIFYILFYFKGSFNIWCLVTYY